MSSGPYRTAIPIPIDLTGSLSLVPTPPKCLEMHGKKKRERERWNLYGSLFATQFSLSLSLPLSPFSITFPL